MLSRNWLSSKFIPGNLRSQVHVIWSPSSALASSLLGGVSPQPGPGKVFTSWAAPWCRRVSAPFDRIVNGGKHLATFSHLFHISGILARKAFTPNTGLPTRVALPSLHHLGASQPEQTTSPSWVLRDCTPPTTACASQQQSRLAAGCPCLPGPAQSSGMASHCRSQSRNGQKLLHPVQA